MSQESARLLYLARHAEPDAHEAGLSSIGSLQAQHLGQRLALLPAGRVTHGPLPRAAETARIVAAQFKQRPALVDRGCAGDYVPHLPRREEIPGAWASTVMSFLGEVPAEEASRGAALGAEAIDLLAGPAVDGRAPVDVVITHAFTIGWLVAHALAAPSWRWFPPMQCHAGLTVIRYELGSPPAVVVANDMAHLPADLRWTGFPDHLRL
jgi:probable phosphoglycerate mutase